MRAEIAHLHKRLGTTMVYVTHDQTEAMTLGDRVAVMDQGEVQQIGTPQELYRYPGNLFVAGFIGSPSINFLPAQIAKSRLILPFGEIELPHELIQGLPSDTTHVIAGIRPEHFRQAKPDDISVGELAFDATIEVAEWLGAELNIYFDVQYAEECLITSWTEDFCGKIRENGTIPIVARLDPAASARKGDKVKLLLDTRKLQFFDQKTGRNILKA
jgi:multiple sugar transport system ATP-binding protein